MSAFRQTMSVQSQVVEMSLLTNPHSSRNEFVGVIVITMIAISSKRLVTPTGIEPVFQP